MENLDNGNVLTPATGSVIGTFNASGFVAVDPALNRVFILGVTSPGLYAIQSFNKTTFAAVSSVSLPRLLGTPIAFLRWGTSGLAILTYNPDSTFNGYGIAGGSSGMLYIVNDPSFVSSSANSAGLTPQQAVHDFPHLDLPSLIHNTSSQTR